MIVSEPIAQYLNHDADKVEGWFYLADMANCCLLDRIQAAGRIFGSICEVGVWQGKSLVLFSHFLKEGEKLFGYDLFPGDIKQKALANLQQYGVPTHVQLIESDTSKLSFEGLSQQLGGGCRILHIDAGHEYHEVLHQMTLFAPFVREGGVIIMDDYQDPEFPGIAAAVLDFAELDRPRRFVPFLAGRNKMYLCEPAFAARYQKALLGLEPVKGSARLTHIRDFSVLIGVSKLPTPEALCLQQVEALERPRPYALNEKQLAERAALFEQNKFGAGSLGA